MIAIVAANLIKRAIVGGPSSGVVLAPLARAVLYLGIESIACFGIFCLQAGRQPDRYWAEASAVAVVTTVVLTTATLGFAADQTPWYSFIAFRTAWFLLLVGISGLVMRPRTRATGIAS